MSCPAILRDMRDSRFCRFFAAHGHFAPSPFIIRCHQNGSRIKRHPDLAGAQRQGDPPTRFAASRLLADLEFKSEEDSLQAAGAVIYRRGASPRLHARPLTALVSDLPCADEAEKVPRVYASKQVNEPSDLSPGRVLVRCPSSVVLVSRVSVSHSPPPRPSLKPLC